MKMKQNQVDLTEKSILLPILIEYFTKGAKKCLLGTIILPKYQIEYNDTCCNPDTNCIPNPHSKQCEGRSNKEPGQNACQL
jgi:hypothetical protein